ncbi:MAG: dTDP-4-dehydrorhamnose 3,5-epimerase [Thermomicrobia bacterium]|nr:dTDP-4-dehydrorhamnose 3,5-epimerase [Thermomicrobia bacterium]MCA1724583.1 dTDP-4-dehydrorhamnose 3,5-epimerase [Thermomicrobia bacterium]
MQFTETGLSGAYLIDAERIADERGFFALTWARTDFVARGLNPNLAQCNLSYNHRKGTVRGMHWQAAPHAETKLVRCTRGGIYDVIVDIRTDSPTYLQWVGVELTAENRRALYIPEECAHGFQTLEDDTEVFYMLTEQYTPASARGMRWNDPAINLTWPLDVVVISPRDAAYLDIDPAR